MTKTLFQKIRESKPVKALTLATGILTLGAVGGCTRGKVNVTATGKHFKSAPYLFSDGNAPAVDICKQTDNTWVPLGYLPDSREIAVVSAGHSRPMKDSSYTIHIEKVRDKGYRDAHGNVYDLVYPDSITTIPQPKRL